MDANVDAPAAWTSMDVRVGGMGVVVEHAADSHHHGECVEVFCMGYRQPIYMGRVLLATEFSRWLGESLKVGRGKELSPDTDDGLHGAAIFRSSGVVVDGAQALGANSRIRLA